MPDRNPRREWIRTALRANDWELDSFVRDAFDTLSLGSVENEAFAFGVENWSFDKRAGE